MIIGGPGAGKTWLAQKLSKILHLQIYCVDDAVYDLNGQLQADADIDQTVRSWTTKESWIIEGGNTRTYADRISRASTLILLDPPRWKRVLRVLVRDSFQRPILYWSWKYDEVFRTRNQAAIEKAESDITVHLIRSDKEMAVLLSAMQKCQ